MSILDRSLSSSSLRTSPSPGRMRQKSFGRQPARVAAAPVSPTRPPSIVTRSEDLSSVALSNDDGEVTLGVHQEMASDLPTAEDDVDHEEEKGKLRAEIEDLQQELRDLRDASEKVRPQHGRCGVAAILC